MAFPLMPPMPFPAAAAPTLYYVGSSWAARQTGDLVFYHRRSPSIVSGWTLLGSDSYEGSAGSGETYNVYYSAGFRVLTGSDTQPVLATFRIFRFAPAAIPQVNSTASPANLSALPKFSGVFTYRYAEGADNYVPMPSAPTVGGLAPDFSYTFTSSGTGNGSYQMHGRVDIWFALEPASYVISSTTSRFIIKPT